MTALEQQEGPYLVTITRERTLGSDDPRSQFVVERKAFVALDDRARLEIAPAGPQALAISGMLRTVALSGGGSVEMDGAVIEVEKTTWRAIFDAIVAADPDAPGQSIPALPPDMWSESGKQAACRAFAASQENGGAR